MAIRREDKKNVYWRRGLDRSWGLLSSWQRGRIEGSRLEGGKENWGRRRQRPEPRCRRSTTTRPGTWGREGLAGEPAEAGQQDHEESRSISEYKWVIAVKIYNHINHYHQQSHTDLNCGKG